MTEPLVIHPASGARVVTGDTDVILFGQPPEVLKGLLLNDISSFNTLVLTDIREKGGVLTNNLEFPLYFFLFMANGHAGGRKLTLVGEETAISHTIRLLRFTLMGPVSSELEFWETQPELKKEWLQVAEELALKNTAGETIAVENFFDIQPFKDDIVRLPELTVKHTGLDQYEVSNSDGSVSINLSHDVVLEPPYPVQKDYVPGGLVKMGLEVLGGASGFTPNEPCTGLALCHNGDYILIDSIPFLDQHLVARGISKNQIFAVFLTHLHDDHCTMFPLMLMPHVVEVITTKEIFFMAMEKLSCSLGWSVESIHEHFKLIEVEPGVPINYFGLLIEAHLTVHSIPTIGATFSTFHQGQARQICVVGDNHNMGAIEELRKNGLVRNETVETLRRLYKNRFSILVADGGAGTIHGDPSDALQSESERVVYVHVDTLANEFNTTFSLAASGKRYTIIEGDPALYSGQVNHYLSLWLGEPLSNRWLRSLLAESEIRRYNSDDVIVVQGALSRDYVYLLLTGYCEVVRHDGSKLSTIARLQAGDPIGEMASITGKGERNASVVSRTPVTVAVFSERIFNAFFTAQGMGKKLRKSWRLRSTIRSLPCFLGLTSTVHLKLSVIACHLSLGAGENLKMGDEGWYLLIRGSVRNDAHDEISFDKSIVAEFGWLPLVGTRQESVTAIEDSHFIYFERQQFETSRSNIPQLNYYIRKFRIQYSTQQAEWQMGIVDPY